MVEAGQVLGVIGRHDGRDAPTAASQPGNLIIVGDRDRAQDVIKQQRRLAPCLASAVLLGIHVDLGLTDMPPRSARANTWPTPGGSPGAWAPCALWAPQRSAARLSGKRVPFAATDALPLHCPDGSFLIKRASTTRPARS